MKHVVHIVESTGGGVLKYLQELSENLDSRCFKQTIIYSLRVKDVININCYFSKNINLIYLPMARQLNVRQDIVSIIKLYKCLKNLDLDIVHLHSSKAGFIGRIATFLLRIKKVYYTPHCYSFLMESENVIKRSIYFFAEFLLSQLGANIIACSKSEYKYAKVLNFFGNNYLVENGININTSNGSKRINRKKNKIVGVGRMDQQKNPFMFINVVAKIKAIRPDVELIWIGDGPLRKKFEQINERLKVGVIVTGWLPHDEVISHLGSATVFLQTSLWEGLPFTILESFAQGTPIVASNIQSHRDVIIDNVNGFLAKNEKEFVNKAIQILDNENLAQRISKAAINDYELKYNYKVFIEKISKIYNL